MPSAKFDADFSDFVNEVTAANSSLKDLNAESAKVGTSLDRVDDAFKGREIAAEATQAANALTQMQASAKGTGDGLTTIATQANKTADAMSKGFDAAPAKIDKTTDAVKDLGTATDGTNTKTQTLSSTYKQFDGVLQAAGVNIGAEVKAIEDLSAAANTGASSLS